MAEERHQQEIAKKAVVYQHGDTNAVTVQCDIPYARRDGEQLTLDVYSPAQEWSRTPAPAVLFVTGFPDAGMRRIVGCNAKDMASYVSWATLMAASGIVAITYTNRTPTADAGEVFRYVRENAASLGIDAHRLGVWACSGNVPTALSVVMDEQRHVRCAAFCYGFMLDVHGSTDVTDAARSFRFANPCDGRSLEELPRDVPLFIARAGRDECAGLNASLDRFVSGALALNLPVTLVNHHNAPHAFDIADDTDMSREVVRQLLTFMRFHLRAHG